jgi:isocitrate dehydrogenase kinase/phosphatase
VRPPVALARKGARAIRVFFQAYRRDFQRITARARRRFEQRDWRGGQADAAERLALYRRYQEAVGNRLARLLSDQLRDQATWRVMKTVYAESIVGFPDSELAETFFNSVTRHVFTTVGVDARIEFVNLDLRRARYGPGSTIHRTHRRRATTRGLVLEALEPPRFEVPWRDLERDADWVAERIDAAWSEARGPVPIDSLDLIEAVFFRGDRAYLVGRLRGGDALVPLVIVLQHGEHGLEVDAVLTSDRDVSVLFSFTRSHFRVAVRHPADVVRFLQSILPRKPLPEIYISIGHPKHGKTEMYRDLYAHLLRSMDRFDFAHGDVGMVMIVFDLRSHDYVFKVIRDRFAAPKKNTRADVLGRYRLVFQHDRAGRLIEAQEFEHLTFEKSRFTPELLDELTRAAARTVEVVGEEVHIHHLYVERRVRPLNLFLREVDAERAERAVLDFGQAIRDLATTNIFPGDLLQKNFGVTRHGRVTFYDYDELSLVTECEFRDLPAPRSGEEELAAEPWYFVGEHDVFPEEFVNFLGLPRALRERFLAAHGEVLTAGYWRTLQERHRSGEVLHVLPYPPERRCPGR